MPRSTDPAVAERQRATRQRWANRLAAVSYRRVLAALLMLAALLLVALGVAAEFGWSWAMMVTGTLVGVLALLIGWET